MSQYNLREQTVGDKAILTALCITSLIVVVFFVYGVWAAFWSVPEKRAQIKELTETKKVAQAQVEELIKIGQDQDRLIDKYKIANN